MESMIESELRNGGRLRIWELCFGPERMHHQRRLQRPSSAADMEQKFIRRLRERCQRAWEHALEKEATTR